MSNGKLLGLEIGERLIKFFCGVDNLLAIDPWAF
jgi:hypothetical protein